MLAKWFLVMGITLFSTASAEIKVLAFAGSTAQQSVNKKLMGEAVAFMKEAGAHVTVVSLKDYPMPFYDADLEKEEGMPPFAKQFRQLMLENQVILIASPEYNSSISGVLKNTLDWMSRSEEGAASRKAFKGKKFILMSASPSASGGARGLVHLKSILEAAGGNVIAKQFTVAEAHKAFDEQGHLKDPLLKNQLKELVQSVVKPQENPLHTKACKKEKGRLQYSVV